MRAALEVWPPEGCVPVVSFEVLGVPKGAGSKNAVPHGRRVNGVFVPHTRQDGTPIISVQDSSGAAGKNWRADIREACRNALDAAHELIAGPVAVRVTFRDSGPTSRFGSGRNAGVLKAAAAAYPHKGGPIDGTKLARALEDALNAFAWEDDRRVVDLWWSRRYGAPGARVDIYALPITVADAGGLEPAGEQAESAQVSLLAS